MVQQYRFLHDWAASVQPTNATCTGYGIKPVIDLRIANSSNDKMLSDLGNEGSNCVSPGYTEITVSTLFTSTKKIFEFYCPVLLTFHWIAMIRLRTFRHLYRLYIKDIHHGIYHSVYILIAQLDPSISNIRTFRLQNVSYSLYFPLYFVLCQCYE